MQFSAEQPPETGDAPSPAPAAVDFFFENASDLCCLIAPEGRFVRVNRAWGAATGWPQDALCGAMVEGFLLPEDVAGFRAYLARAGAAQDRQDPQGTQDQEATVLSFRTRDGGHRLIAWGRAGAAQAPDGSFMVIAQDVTGRSRPVEPMLEPAGQAQGTGVWEIDLHDLTGHLSPEVYDIYGLPQDSTPLCGDAAMAPFAEAARPQLLSAFRMLVDEGAPFDLELPFQSLDGRDFWVRIVGFRRMRAGRPVSIFGTISDATEARTRRRWLERLSAVAEATTNGVALFDRDMRVEWMNPALERLTGVRLDDIRGMSMLDVPDPEQPDFERIEAINKSLRKTGSARSEVFKLRPDGTSYWVDIAIEALRDDEGTITGYIAVETDITESKEYARRLEVLERSAREAHERLVEAVEALPDAFVLFGTDDRLILCNDRYLEFYPQTAPVLKPGISFEMIERFALENGQLRVAEGDEESWLTRRLAGRAAGGETLVQHLPDGRVLRTVERRTASGELVAFHIDITELALKERAATTARNALQATLDAMPDLLFEIDIDGTFHEARNGTASRLERDEGWYIGRSIYDTLPAESADRIMREMRQMLEQERASGYARPVQPFDIRDEIRWFGVGIALKRVEGDCPRFIVVARDITGRKRVEEERARDAAELAAANVRLQHALAERDAAENRFFDIAGISHDWFWEQDAEMRFTFISESINEAGAIPVEAHFGRTREELFEPYDDPRLRAAAAHIRDCCDKRLPFSDVIYPIVDAQGKTTWVRTSGAPVQDREGRLIGYRGVGSNVTDLIEARLRAEEASAAKSRFLASMSHEIRTPLNGIMGMAELLHDKITDSEERELVSVIRDSGDALATILNDILDFSKIEAGLLDLSMADFVPAELARRVESLHRLKASEKGLRFSVQLAPEARKPRNGDEHRILQVLHNLVSNAIKFTDRGSVTVIVAGKADGPLELQVRDTGIGLSPEQKARIFDEFVQADSSISRRYGGTGLGLSISRKLVRLMGGTIEIDTAEGRGTIVRVSLPLAPAQATAVTAAAEAEAGPELPALPAGLVALVADDNATNRLLMEKFLERLGVGARVVAGGIDAVAAAQSECFDLLLFDISMPDMTGPEALAEIRALEARLGRRPAPAIAVTANAMHHQVQEYLDAGFVRHVGKPIRVEDLGRAMQFALGHEPAGRSISPRRAKVS